LLGTGDPGDAKKQPRKKKTTPKTANKADDNLNTTAGATTTPTKATRKLSIDQLFSKLYYDEGDAPLKPIIDAAWEKHKTDNPLDPMSEVGFRAKETRKLWDTADDVVKEHVQSIFDMGTEAHEICSRFPKIAALDQEAKKTAIKAVKFHE
jgi:hypothetical protein